MGSNENDKIIESHFLNINGEALCKKNPKTDTMKQPFSWLLKECNCVTGETREQLKKINELNELRLLTEEHFSKFPRLKKETQKESSRVGKNLQKKSNKIALASTKSRVELGFGGLKAEKRQKFRP